MSLEKLNDFEYCNENGYYKLSSEENTFNYSDGLEEEQYILDSIQLAKNKTSYSDELKNNIRDWSSKYHLSKERANILRALEFENKKILKVLEIGGGCGAITRYLGEEFGEVDTIEGSAYRSKIISERCNDLENVNVYCSNLFDTNLPENYYDLVVMIGVLEYSNVYSQIDNDPVKSAQIVLESLNSSLKSNGQMILAIENKFGLKYFTGAAEDHTGIQFDSIVGYTKTNTPVTYGKETLSKILSNAGFKDQNWFYPYPDYKLPSVLISDSAAKDTSLFVDNWIETPFTDSGKNYKTIFNESLALRELYREGMLGQFANSFLILAGKNKITSNQNWLIKKINSNRFHDYCTEIKLISKNDELLIKRKLLFSEDTRERPENAKYLHNICDESYIKGELLTSQLNSYLVNNEIFSGLLEYSMKLKKYLEQNFSTQEFDSEGFLVLLPNSIDIIFKNIIVLENNEWVSFDNEWEVKNDNVTIDYILYRAIVYYLASYSFNLFENSEEKFKQMVYELLNKLFKNFNEERYNELLGKEEQFQAFVNSGKLTNAWNNLQNEESAGVDKLIYESEELIQKEEYEKAKKILISMLNNDDSNVDVYNNLSVVSILQNNFNEAGEYIQKVLNLDPQNDIAIGNLEYIIENTDVEKKVKPLKELLKKSKLFEKKTSLDTSLKLTKIKDFDEFTSYNYGMQEEYKNRSNYEFSLISSQKIFPVRGFCNTCNAVVDFQVDFWNSYKTDKGNIPNWRERLVCPSCHLNNRMRLALHIIKEELTEISESKIYIAEQTTQTYQRLKALSNELIGSEFLGDNFPRGELDSRGIRHEDFTNLTFKDNEFDMVLSFDVFEHIPDYKSAFSESYRILKNDGTLVFSVPFDRNSKKNIMRAKLDNTGVVKHILPAEYHGDPLNITEGCLCFYHFGWEMLDDLRNVGFNEPHAVFCYSKEYGYLGGDQIIFVAYKSQVQLDFKSEKKSKKLLHVENV